MTPHRFVIGTTGTLGGSPPVVKNSDEMKFRAGAAGRNIYYAEWCGSRLRNREIFQGKKCLVLGLAKSGYAAAVLLRKLGADVVVNDRGPLEDDPRARDLLETGVEMIGGGHPANLLEQPFDWVIKNPGIRYDNPIVKEAQRKGIPVVTEPEIAGLISEAPFVAITGSNGKTTTTTLIGEMLKEGGKRPLVAGNIGTVVCDVAAEASPENVIVTELSSFQLLGVRTFHPHVSVFLNLFDAHLDYHGTRENYAKAKANIFANQTADDFAVVNAEDADVMRLVSASRARPVPFSVNGRLEHGASIQESSIFFQGERIMACDDVRLPGKHNLENVLAAVAVAKLYGVGNEAIASVLKSFGGVKHRLQFVGEVRERKFYNDSKATNILATQKAVSAFDAPVILLAGGLDRGNGFDELAPVFQKLKAVVTFGETAPKMKEAAFSAGMKKVEHVDNVQKAVPTAFQLSDPGDVILLSPACASWDQYRTFEERGDVFIEAVHRLS
ncbi:MAG TPA: UDP-N-acetylmuramoyl-L-alanine--D-glutamate ligase [Bacillales bacterium]|nr:UDP-N-acetylmuramoyl-L-alanine--D-glutamate ligase [Bacillales bacterium]